MSEGGTEAAVLEKLSGLLKEDTGEKGLVEANLQPKDEIDNAGFGRRIYTYGGKTFAFRGREELPKYPSLSVATSRILGSRPAWVSDEDYQKYKNSLRGSPEAEVDHFLTTKTLLGVVELALELKPEDPVLGGLKDGVSKGSYDSTALEIIDDLIAANYVDNEAKGFIDEPDPDAEALVLLSLVGNVQAKEQLAKKKAFLKDTDQERKKHKETEGKKVDAESLDPKELVCVHATSYLPQAGPNGELYVKTKFDSTGRDIPRNTVHTSLNHKVEGHVYGSWEGTSYTIIAPFAKMMEVNGVPAMLNTVDTYWTRNPGESLTFPNATLIMPGKDEPTGLYDSNGNIILYRSQDFDMSHFKQAVTGEIRRHGVYAIGSFNQIIFDPKTGLYKSRELLDKTWKLDELFKHFDDTFFGGNFALNEYDRTALDQLLGLEDQFSVRDQVMNFIKAQSLEHAAKSPEEFTSAINQLADAMTAELDRYILGEASRVAVEEAIKQQGFSVKRGGMWGWDAESDVASKTQALAEKLGINAGKHTNSANAALEYASSDAFKTGLSDSKNIADFDWTKYRPEFSYRTLLELDDKTRRVFYESGLLTSRTSSPKDQSEFEDDIG